MLDYDDGVLEMDIDGNRTIDKIKCSIHNLTTYYYYQWIIKLFADGYSFNKLCIDSILLVVPMAASTNDGSHVNTSNTCITGMLYANTCIEILCYDSK